MGAAHVCFERLKAGVAQTLLDAIFGHDGPAALRAQSTVRVKKRGRLRGYLWARAASRKNT